MQTKVTLSNDLIRPLMGKTVTFETLAFSLLNLFRYIIGTNFNFLDQFNFFDCCRNCFDGYWKFLV